MADEITAKEVKLAVDELRDSVEKYGNDSSDFKEKADKIEAALEGFEGKQQENLLARKQAEKEAGEFKERMEVLELEVAKGSVGQMTGDYKDSVEYKALSKMIVFGEKGIDGDEFKTLRMDTDVAGGYLTTVEMDNVITKKITEISAVRRLARVRTVSKKTLEMAIRTSIPTATYEGEAAAGSDSESGYGAESVTAHRLTTTVPVTMDVLMDSSFDLEAEINADVAEAFGFTEGNKFVLGTGVKQPEGFLVNAAVVAGASTSASTGTIEADDLTLLTGELKVGYDPMYAFNRKTLAFLRTLKATIDGHYIWQAGLAGAAPNTINGEAYAIFNDMPDIANGALAVVYADFMRGYTITDRTGLTVIRDDLTKKREAIVELTFHRYNTGQVTLPEAFVALKIKS